MDRSTATSRVHSRNDGGLLNMLFRRTSSRSTDSETEFVGRYRLGRVIAAGGSGTVYSATDPTLHRAVAVKIPHRSVTLDARARARFVREARLAASIQHPNIVPILDFGDQAGIPYLVMPLLRGIDLANIGNRMPRSLVIELGSALARALDVVHRTGILHRDIKPSNIMIVDGVPILVDFGLAKAFHDVDVTEWATSPGTPRFMSPEQLSGRKLDPRSDVYSLAVTLTELLHGRRLALRPECANGKSRARRVGSRSELDFVLELARSSARSKRPRTALEFAQRIEACRVRN